MSNAGCGKGGQLVVGLRGRVREGVGGTWGSLGGQDCGEAGGECGLGEGRKG